MPARDHGPRRSDPAVIADAIAPAARRRTTSPARVFVVCALGGLVLGSLAAPDLPGWADRLPDGPATAELRMIANGWAALAARLGLGRPHRVLRRDVQQLLDQRWQLLRLP